MVRLAFLVCLFVALSACSASSEKGEGLGYQGYSNEGELVAKELDRLKSDPNVMIRKDKGWTIASSSSGRIIWSFTPENHSAHPSYVKREIIDNDGAVYIDTSASCGAEKRFCDELVQDFIDLNEKIIGSMSR